MHIIANRPHVYHMIMVTAIEIPKDNNGFFFKCPGFWTIYHKFNINDIINMGHETMLNVSFKFMCLILSIDATADAASYSTLTALALSRSEKSPKIWMLIKHCLSSAKAIPIEEAQKCFVLIQLHLMSNIFECDAWLASWIFFKMFLFQHLKNNSAICALLTKRANSENCGPTPGNNFDLEVGQRSRLQHGVNWKGLSQGSCMPNINALSLILQKIWARLKFLWQTDRQRDRRMSFNVPRFRERRGTTTCHFVNRP